MGKTVKIGNFTYGYSETEFEMPKDYGIDYPVEMIPSVDCGLASLPDNVRPAMFALHAKESVLRVIMNSPQMFQDVIQRLILEIGSLRTAISYEYLNAYDRAKGFKLNI